MQLQVTNKAFQGKGDINFFQKELTALFTKILKGGSGIGVIQATVSRCKAKTPQSGIFDCKVVDTADKFGAFWIQTSRYLAFPPTRCRITGISEQEFIKFLDEYKKPKQKELPYEEVKPVSEIATLTAPVAVVAPAPIMPTALEEDEFHPSQMLKEQILFYLHLLEMRKGNETNGIIPFCEIRKLIITMGFMPKKSDGSVYEGRFRSIIQTWLYSPLAKKVMTKVAEWGSRGEGQEASYLINWDSLQIAVNSDGETLPKRKLTKDKTMKIRRSSGDRYENIQSSLKPGPASSFQLGSMNDFMSQFMAIKSREKAHNEGGVAWLLSRDIHTAETELRDAEEELARVTQEVANAKAKLNALKARHDAMPHPLSEDEKAVLAEFRETLATLANGYILMTTDCNDRWSSQRVELL